ncbi:MAG TPA: HEAT repeat domain-containing protein [Chloroflexia bacterium]|nr:HEAT repeat domain-containing protein [Chloroflexia bacterium]
MSFEQESQQSQIERAIDRAYHNDGSVVDKLLEALSQISDRETRLRIIKALARFKERKIAAKFLYILQKDKDEEIKVKVASLLGLVGSSEISNQLLPYLADKNSQIRAGIAKSLSIIKDNNMVEPLIEAVKTEQNEEVLEKLLFALGVLADERATGILMEVLANSSNPARRNQAVLGLGWIKDRRAVDLLLEVMLNDEDEDVRSNAADALGEIGDKRVESALIQVLTGQPEIAHIAAEALGNLRSTKAVSPLLASILNKEQYIGTRFMAIEALEKIGDRSKEVFETLKNISNDNEMYEDTTLGSFALEVIEKLKRRDS